MPRIDATVVEGDIANHAGHAQRSVVLVCSLYSFVNYRWAQSENRLALIQLERDGKSDERLRRGVAGLVPAELGAGLISPSSPTYTGAPARITHFFDKPGSSMKT